MTYDEVLGRARGNMGPHCKACPVCNGSGCKNTIPGPGSKGLGTVFPRNYAAWQEIALNMDTICPMEPVDTELTLFGHSFSLPVFAAPLGAVRNHYGDKLTEAEYDAALVRGCRDAGIAAFLGDGLADFLFATACHTIREQGFAVPTVKPWSRDLVFRKIDQAKEHGAQLLCMDIDAALRNQERGGAERDHGLRRNSLPPEGDHDCPWRGKSPGGRSCRNHRLQPRGPGFGSGPRHGKGPACHCQSRRRFHDDFGRRRHPHRPGRV